MPQQNQPHQQSANQPHLPNQQPNQPGQQPPNQPYQQPPNQPQQYQSQQPAQSLPNPQAGTWPAAGGQPGSAERAPRSPITRVPRWDPGQPGSADRPTTAPSPADLAQTDTFAAVGQPEPRRLWEEEPTPRKSRPTWLFLSLGVLVVLALVVGGIWYFGGKSDTSNDADQVSPPPVPTSNQPASLEDKLPALSGKPGQDNSTMALDKAVQVRAVSQADADLMRAAGADELVYHAYAEAANGTLMIAVPAGSPAQAGQLVQGLRQNLVTGGFDSTPLGPAATDLLYSGSSPAGRVVAFWYTSGSVAVGVGVSAPLDADPAALRSRIEQIRAKVAATLPAR
ncbi:hypothetical protein GCM10022222_19440 [Amycolatopsis ultiminotia]|uniref:Uncharacterized protein n=1 Tax=Amycolatopsis ultiminotia TaxID=543629 RepID=A0ABP6VHD4_9PSEU